MDLQSLQQSLAKQLEKNSKRSIRHTDTWCVPIHTLKVSYKPVVKSKMDILMKMLLQSIDRYQFRNAEQLSEILLVELLFVQDLMTKMQKTGLITKLETHYELTSKGKQQLTNGVFEEEQEMKKVELLYSPTHGDFLTGDVEEVLDFTDFPEKMYRHQVVEETLKFDDQVIINQLTLQDEQTGENEEEENPVVISSIDLIEETQVNDVPCIEMILFDEEQKLFISKVYNTLLDNWDKVLEQQLTEKEGTSWAETY